MNNDPSSGLGGQPLNPQSTREWKDLTPYLGGFAQFPATRTEDKVNFTEAAATINTYPAAAARVNADGLVVMRGLLNKAGSANLATGDVVMTVPKDLLPNFPQEYRFYGGTCQLRFDMATRQLKVDLIHVATSFLILNNVIYYKD